jgi:hypothetical protein
MRTNHLEAVATCIMIFLSETVVAKIFGSGVATYLNRKEQRLKNYPIIN